MDALALERIGIAMLALSVCPLPGMRTARAAAPLDLVWSDVDESGRPRNPEWRSSAENASAYPDVTKLCALPSKNPFADCSTSQPTLDLASGVTRMICRVDKQWARFELPGHVNWRNVTYEGTVSWESLSFDGDVNVRLVPSAKAALTSTRTRYLGLEFDGIETIEEFTTPWWLEFNDAAWDGSAGKLIDGHRAVLTGLLGLDCEHGCYTEIHPVYAMAIQGSPANGKDVWAYFARNVGNEGFCSRYLHSLDGTRVTLRIPWKDGATAVRLANPVDVHVAMANQKLLPPRMYWARGEGVLIVITFPKLNPSRLTPRALVHGEIHLDWQIPEDAVPAVATAPRAGEATPVEDDASQERSGEQILAAIEGEQASTPPRTRAPRGASRGAANRGILLKVGGLQPVESLKNAEPIAESRGAKPQRAEAPPRVVAQEKLARDRKKLRALCEQHDGELAGLPGVCKQVGANRPAHPK
jgi:hypothetical protein